MNISATVCLLAASWGLSPPGVAEEPIQIGLVQLRLIEQVEVPAEEAGLLVEVPATEGQVVSKGTLLARVNDAEATLKRRRAEIELSMARRQAEDDVNVRFAHKTLEVVKAELQRASDSVAKYRKSISQTEIDRLRLAVERAALEVKQAERDLDLAQLTAKVKENDLQTSQRDVKRRTILSPLDGVVVEVNRRPGEWVQPGETVVRILRIDRLKAEGFLDARRASHNLAGCPVTLIVDIDGGVTMRLPGRVAFVSPELDPYNGQVRLWAEIENPDLVLRPGLEASLVIHAGKTVQTAKTSSR